MEKNKKKLVRQRSVKHADIPEKALENMAEITGVAEMITYHIDRFEVTMARRMEKLEQDVYELKHHPAPAAHV